MNLNTDTIMKHGRAGLCIVLLCAAFAQTAGAAATSEESPTQLLQEMTRFFVAGRSRHPGSVGNLETEQAVADLFASTDLPSGEIRFVAPFFRTGKTTLTLTGDTSSFRLYPMHPTLVRPGNFTEKSFDASLVYMGTASVEDLKNVTGVPLKGAIAVLEFDGGHAWMDLLRFGVRGFIFLGKETYFHDDLTKKMFGSNAAVPRFFVDSNVADTLRSRLKKQGAVAAHMEAEPTRWENRTLRDLWTLIPGADTELQREVVVIYAPIDSNCIVPDKAYGASSAANLYLLMRLFKEFSERPPQRSVLLVAVNAHTQLARGESLLAWNLLVPRSEIDAAQDVIAGDLRIQEALIQAYEKFDLNPPNQEDHAYLEELRTLTDNSTGRNLSVKEPIVNLAKRQVNIRKAEQLRIYNAESDPDKKATIIGQLTQEREKYLKILTLFNKARHQTSLKDLNGEELSILRGYVQDIIDLNRDGADLCRRELARNAANTRIRRALEGRDVKFVLALDFRWTTPRVGFSSYNPLGDQTWQHKWGLNVAAIAARLEKDSLVALPRNNIFLDTMTKQGGLPEAHFFATPTAGVLFFQLADKTPAFAAKTPFGGLGQLFSPADTFANLNADNVAAVMNYMPVLLRSILADRNIANPTELRKPSRGQLWSVRLETFKFDEFSASVTPELPVPGTLLSATLGVHVLDRFEPLVCGDVMNTFFALTDPTAAATLFGVYGNPYLNTAAFHFDPDFTVVDHTIDAGDAESKVSSTVKSDAEKMRLALFPCSEFAVSMRANSSMIAIDPIMTYQYQLLGGVDDSAPKKYGISGATSIVSGKVVPTAEGPVSFFFQPDEQIKILAAGKIVALNSSDDKPHGTGYRTQEEMGPDFFAAAARDMSHLNRERLKKLEGVSDKLAVEFLQRGNAALERMQTSLDRNDYLANLRYLFEGLGAQLKAYIQTSSITNDMLKAVVFYLALMLPFCFFVMKLLFKFVKIETQMVSFGLLFLGTFLVFRLIHPAFRVAQAPAAMFIAFVMGGLGLFVIKLLHDRFEGEMQILFNTYASMDTTEVGYSTVGQEAMLIGVNNMKRRRLRTAFTTATIVLVTFTMLAFTSISKKLSPTIIKRDTSAPYTGLMYHWPGNKTMDEDTARILTQNYADRGDIFVRRWLLGRVELSNRITMPIPDRLAASTGKELLIDGVLGLSKKESTFLGEFPISYGRFFQTDDAAEVILPMAVAETLGITPENFTENSIRFRGMDFAIAGVLNDELFKEIKDLNQRSIRPIKNLAQQQDPGGDVTMAAQEDQSSEKTGVFFVDVSSLLIMPVAMVERFGGGPYSVSVRLNRAEDIWPAVDELLTMSRANKFYMASRSPFFVGGEQNGNAVEPGVYYIGEGYRTSIGGLSFLIIPLLIASTIILNTMLGSVYERRKEIAVYNAVGLNPTHIGMFFLAESFVYSVIGSVGGYLIGQLLSIGLTKTGVISDINLNFSSLSVVYVIMFTVAVVMLSTLYPSMVATKAAVPSGKRKWALPEHDGQSMVVVFPFIYQPELIHGILGYLHAYFSQFTEASFGDLIAHMEASETGSDEKNRKTFSMRYHLALAPFDLGVTQVGEFHAAYDDRVQAYRISMHVNRISGQDTNWATTNKPFLEQLRTYLLHWRNLDASEHALYVQQGKQLFSEA